VETVGNRNLQTRTYKQEIQLNKLLESDKQVVGPVSTQAPLDWRLGEWGDEFIDTYQGASTISRKTLDWKRSKISMFELDVVPQSWK
jgi:hypothetical protein